MITDDEKLGAVEAAIEELRWARNEPDIPEHRRLAALKSIAEDLRATKPEASSKALNVVEQHINAAKRKKERFGYLEVGSYRSVCEAVLAHWAAIRRALVIAAEAKSDATTV